MELSRLRVVDRALAELGLRLSEGQGAGKRRRSALSEISSQVGNRAAGNQLCQACTAQQTAQWHRHVRGDHKSSCAGCLAGQMAGGRRWTGFE